MFFPQFLNVLESGFVEHVTFCLIFRFYRILLKIFSFPIQDFLDLLSSMLDF
jgi:hypothetical protein